VFSASGTIAVSITPRTVTVDGDVLGQGDPGIAVVGLHRGVGLGVDVVTGVLVCVVSGIGVCSGNEKERWGSSTYESGRLPVSTAR
jgi:hypothetical protein